MAVELVREYELPRRLRAGRAVRGDDVMREQTAWSLGAQMGLGFSPSSTAGPSVPYSPLNEPGAVLRLDMQDAAAYVESGGVVTQFTNTVSDVDWPEASARPAFDGEGLNGHPCMVFDGINDRFISTEAAVFAPFNGTGATYSIAGVWQHSIADSIQRVFGVGNSGSANGHRSWGTSQTGAGRWVAAATSDAGVAANADSSGASDTSAHVFLWTGFDSSGFKASIWVDNVADAGNPIAHAADAITPNRSAVGCRPGSTPGVFMGGNLGELIVWSVALDADARLRVFNYLSAKWAP